MAVYKIYHKDGSVLADANGKEIEVHSIEYNGTWMGECFVTVTFENESPIDFSIGDYIVYRNERFEINYDPGKIKCSSKDSYGGAFKYDSVKFNALSDELVRCDMLDLVLYDNNLHYTALPQFAFYVESLDDLLDRIQANLDELYGKAAWKLYSRNKERSIQRGCTAEGWESAYGAGTADNVIESTSISISDQNCWDALSLVNSQFDVNFIIRDRNVYVGTAGVPTANIFKYGKDKGLYEIEQNSESDQAIVTRLRAYGSNRNLPNHYYADLGSIPFLNITGDYHDGSTDSGLSVMMEDSVYAGMFTDIISDNGSNIKHCRIRGSIDGYEFDGEVELVKKDSTKSTTRLLVEGKAVCDAIKAKIDAGIVQVDFISGANKTKFNGNRINYVSNLPNNMACDRLMLPGFPNKSLSEWWNEQSEAKKAWLNPGGKGHDFSVNRHRPYVDSLNIGNIGIRPASVFFDQDDKVNGIVEIYPTIEEMEVDGVRIDEIYTGTNIEDDGRFGDGETVANVPIYLSPKVNFDIRALMQEDFTIHMKDGMCAGREFKVAGCTKEKDGSWKLMIERNPDSSLDLYFPYNDFQIKKGDHFVLTGIELPDAYVEAASEKLLKYCIAYLDKNDYTRYVYQPKVDEIFMARQHDTAVADSTGLTRSLYMTLKEGDIMLFKDDDLGIDAEITIDQLTIKEEDGKIPTYEITLREEKEVGTIQKIQNQISSIASGNGGAGTAGGGLSTTQIKNLIDSVGSDRFLSKLNPDIAAGIITFLQGTNWGNFTSETGAAMTVDPSTGQTYMEVDRLKVRLKAFFEQLEIQKVGFVGGKLVVTKGQGVDILDVENIYDTEGNVSAYRCYFLGEQEGRKIDNLLRVKDQMICKDFNVSEGTTDGATNKYYWRLATAVSSEVVKRGNNVCHWVDLSATDCDTNSDIPEIGDTICHLGNREDTDRQGAEILSVVDANSPSFTIYSGINSYSLVNKEYIDMGVVNGKAYCNIYGSTYIGDRERQKGYLRWNDDTKTFEIKGTIDITSPLSSGGTIGGAITDAANAYKGEFDAFTSNVNEVIGGFQAQIDGVIETWFYEPEPTLGNEPAVNWTDNATKDKHLGDLYYSGEGLAYRFQKEGDNYVWKQIDDTAITKALAEAKAANDAANAAQGTADSKMRVFVVQPTADDEYSVGDMWVNATYPADGSQYNNDILKCKTPKSKGTAFSINHWEKASKYTDDTAAQEAQKKANEAATAAQEINASITAIDGNVDVALKDKIITKTEAAAIKEALNGLDAIMADVNKTKEELINNAVYKNIADDVKTDYTNAYDTLVAAYNELSEYINGTLLVAKTITDEILSTYTTKYSNFKTKYEAYVSKLTVVRNSMDALLNTRIGDIATMLGGLKATTDAMNESTQINGGLILSSLLALGYTNNSIFNVMSGVSGLYESGETGGGIAFWAGGHRIDINNCTKNADGTYSIGGKVVNPADFLVRHDGTGYAAGGKMWWDEDGKIHADPQSFLINEQYVGNVMQLFKFEYSGGTEFTNIVHAIPQKPFESLSIGANGLTLYNGDKSAKFYIKDGVLFLDGDLAVTGGITMYASNGVASGMIDQVYAVLDPTIFSKQGDYITIKDDIGGGTVKAVKVGSTQYDPDSDGIISLPDYPTVTTLEWDNILNKPSSFIPSAHTHAISEITNLQTTLDGKAAASHTHSYLPLSGGTMTGIITGNTGSGLIVQSANTGSWCEGLRIYPASNNYCLVSLQSSDSRNVFAMVTNVSSHVAYFDYRQDGGINKQINMPYKSGTIALTSDLSAYLPLTGGKLTGSLEINSVASGYGYNEGIRMHVASNGWCGVVMCGSDNTGSSGTSANTWGVWNYEGTFYINRNNSSDTTSYILCNKNGNWGMGTNSPSYKLHVAGDIYTTTGFKKNGSSDSYVLLGGGGHKAESSLSVSYAASAGNADTLDGYHYSSFAWASHSHSYLPLSGGTLSGSGNILSLSSSNSNSWIYYLCNSGQYKASTGYYEGLAFLANESNYYRIGVTDSGNPEYWQGPLSSSTRYTLLHTGNYSSYALPLSGGTMTNDARISHGGNLYIGRADNSGWVGCQDLCSQSALGDTYWSLRTSGAFHATSITSSGSITVNDGTHIKIGNIGNGGSGSVANYISAGRGFSKSSGLYGVKVLCCEQADCQSGLGQDLSPSANGYDMNVVACYSSYGYATLSFVAHGVNSTTYYDMGKFTFDNNAIQFRVYGDILANGGITMYSDLRKKNILSDEVLSVKEIAAAPLFRHTYKSDDNQYIHVGTSAQYWSGIHEDWFTRKDGEGYYQMELQNLGVAMGISLAREIVKYESKTDKKIRLMKKRINELEKANESLEARVKELEERRTA